MTSDQIRQFAKTRDDFWVIDGTLLKSRDNKFDLSKL